jgi:starch phosphorylase
MSKIVDSPAVIDEQSFWGGDNATYEAHLAFDHVVSTEKSSPRERFEALARTIRDQLSERWVETYELHDRENPKMVYYLSMEFLIGRSLINNVINLGMWPHVEKFLATHHLSWTEIVENEFDAGLGNGGLGRLAACFIESLATLGIPAIGYGLRYEYGIFRQEIRGGYQVEQPDHWLRFPDPWEVSRHGRSVDVTLGCSFEMHQGQLHQVPGRPMMLVGIPHDRPVVGYGGRTINGLRLWGAVAHEQFNFGEFSKGDFVSSVVDKIVAETLTRVLYPDDSTARGQALRFLQEYFLVACSLADIVRRFRRRGNDWAKLPDKVAIQLNDTHPSMSVAELMRILLDQAGLDFDTAWDLTRRTLAYTNHTILPEALEKWPVEYFEVVLPRHLEIIYQINERFLKEVAERHPGDNDRQRRMSLIEEGANKKVRMAHLAIVGSHSTNGVAAIHTRLLKAHVLADFAEHYPERFNNKTNGVTPRRWLLQCNPGLAQLISDAIGTRWISHLEELARLKPLADDPGFRERFRGVKREAKTRFSDWLRHATGQLVDPNTIIDCQVKRIHEYKRQLLNVLNIVSLYLKLHEDPAMELPPRTFLLAGKAAPSYKMAKVIIKLINCVAETINHDPVSRGKVTVHFLPDYSVTLAERLIPASDVSEQISTAGYEASGTSCMKFMMNGALTVATRDGANIEMAEEVGEDNMFLFGLTAEQVAQSRGWYKPAWHYEHERETRRALDLIFSDHFNPGEPGLFAPLKEMLLQRGDFYMNLADLSAYSRTQARVSALYRDHDAWSRKAVLNVAASGKFSSDRTILQYADEIWGAAPCLPDDGNGKSGA